MAMIRRFREASLGHLVAAQPVVVRPWPGTTEPHRLGNHHKLRKGLLLQRRRRLELASVDSGLRHMRIVGSSGLRNRAAAILCLGVFHHHHCSSFATAG
jgi:hypothetical protein